MYRNITIAFILIGAILVVWLFINTPEQTEQTRKEQDTAVVVEQKSEEPLKTLVEEKRTSPPESQQTEESSLGMFSKAVTGSGRIITIETDLAIYELSTKGGNFHKVYLKKFNNWYSSDVNGGNDFYKTSVQLINYSVDNAYDIAFVSSEGKAINTKILRFNAPAKSRYQISGKDTLVIKFKLELDQSRAIVKKYVFGADSYLIKSKIEFVGFKGLIADNAYVITWESGIRMVEENRVIEAIFSSANIYFGDEEVVINAPSEGEKITRHFFGRVDWLAVRNKNFAAIMIPSDPNQVEGAYVEGQTFQTKNLGRKEIYNVRLDVPFRGSDHEEISVGIYMGPVEYELLRK